MSMFDFIRINTQGNVILKRLKQSNNVENQLKNEMKLLDARKKKTCKFTLSSKKSEKKGRSHTQVTTSCSMYITFRKHKENIVCKTHLYYFSHKKENKTTNKHLLYPGNQYQHPAKKTKNANS